MATGRDESGVSLRGRLTSQKPHNRAKSIGMVGPAVSLGSLHASLTRRWRRGNARVSPEGDVRLPRLTRTPKFRIRTVNVGYDSH